MIPEVTFGELPLDDRRRAEIRGTLRRIQSDGEPGSWPEPVERIEVTRLLDGGRSGAMVVQVFLHRGDHRLLHVVKIGPAAELAKEWTAYVQWIRPVGNVLFAPILAVTPEVITNAPGDAWGLPAAVVYDHVGQHAGDPDAIVRTLEETVLAAVDGPGALADDAVRIIDDLFTGAGHVLSNRYRIRKAPTSLRSHNRELGPSVTLTVNRVDEAGRLHYGQPDTGHAAAAFLPDDEVLLRSLGGRPKGDLVPGELLTLTGLRPHRFDGTLVAHGDDIVVEIRFEPGTERQVNPPELMGRREFSVCGLITATRGTAHRTRLVTAAGEFDGMFADPFSTLGKVLTEPIGGRVDSVVHGDLNPRNVLLTGGRAYLIDYAHTTDGRAQPSDFCWLELGLLRDVFAGKGLAALIDLQRVLALASQLLDLGTAADDVESACLELADRLIPGLRTPFRLLWAIRKQAHRHYPGEAGEPWLRSYLGQLLIASHRTVKWTGPAQSEAKLCATIAAAAVASEWLGGPNPFRFWKAAELSESLRTAVPVLDFGNDHAVRLCAAVVTALESHGGLSRTSEALLAQQRARLVQSRCAASAERIVLALSEDHERYYSLSADPVPSPPQPSDDTDALSLAARLSAVAIVGNPGSGKTAVTRELTYRLAAGVISHARPELPVLPVRVPVPTRAAELLRIWSTVDIQQLDPVALMGQLLSSYGLGTVPDAALLIGTIHLIVDGLDELAPGGQLQLATALRALRDKYPRVPLVVSHRCCGRYFDEDATLAGLSVIQLRELDLPGMRGFLHQALGSARMRSGDVNQLLASLLDNPEWQRADPRRPAVLRTVAEHIRRGGSPKTLPKLGDVAVEQLLGTGEHAWLLIVRCETLAAHLLDSGAPNITIEAVRDLLGEGDWLDHLASRGMLLLDGYQVRFAERTHQDYFGARSLLHDRPSASRRVLQQTWHEACLIFASFPGMTADTIAIASAVARTAPGLAGRLLRAAQVTEFPEFVDAQVKALGDPDAGPIAWREAARALYELGGATAQDRLSAAAADTMAAMTSRREALLNLAELHDRTLSAAERRTTAQALISAVHRVLTEPSPAGLCAVALRIIGMSRLRGLELFAGMCLDPSQPWEITREAMNLLRELGIALPDAFAATYRAACLGRVAELERILPATATAREARALQAELVELVCMLAEFEPVFWLLRRRFAFDLSAPVADRLDELVITGTTGCERILTEDVDATYWLDLLDAGDPVEAAAAAHRLLRDAPEWAVDVLARTGTGAPAHRLLIAAAAVAHGGSAGLKIAERLFRRLIPVVRGDQLEGLAALLRAIFPIQRSLGIRIAWTASAALAERGLPQRHQRPWVTALARSRGTLEDFDAMLCVGDEESGRLALGALASYDFHRSAEPGPRHEFSTAARERLLGLQPPSDAPTEETAQWILATATVGLTEALPLMRPLVKGLATAAMERVSGRHGLLVQAPLADALTVWGYLARLAADQHTDVGDTYRMLRDFDAASAHTSVETGRLIGLAYLGDWEPLLSALPRDVRVDPAARNAIERWVPGPFTPVTTPGHRDIALWITARLADPELPVARRWLLAELKQVAQHRAGVLVI